MFKKLLIVSCLLFAGCQTAKTEVLFFQTQGCGPCHSMLEGTLKEESVQKWFRQNGHLHVVGYNDTILYQKYDVTAFPTTVVVKNGEEAGRLVGSIDSYNYLNFLNRSIK